MPIIFAVTLLPGVICTTDDSDQLYNQWLADYQLIVKEDEESLQILSPLLWDTKMLPETRRQQQTSLLKEKIE